jgi:hypothetical protein
MMRGCRNAFLIGLGLLVVVALYLFWPRDRSDTKVGYCPPDPIEAYIFLKQQGLLIDSKITLDGVQAIVSPAMLEMDTDPQQLDQLVNVVDCVHTIDRATRSGIDVLTPVDNSVRRTFDETALTALRQKRARNGTLVQ